MGSAPRCPRCGSTNTRKSDDRLLKGGLAHVGEFALGFGLGWLGLGDLVEDHADNLNFAQYVDDEFQCRDCGCVWKPGQSSTYVSQNPFQGSTYISPNQSQRRNSQPKKKKKKPQSNNQQQIENASKPSYSRRELVDIIAQCEGLRPGSCNESTILTTDNNVIKQRLQSLFGIQLLNNKINRVNTYKGVINVILDYAVVSQGVTVNSSSQKDSDDFGSNWDAFFENVDSHLDNRQNFEKEYNAICRKARSQNYDNSIEASAYYYMASVLCYFYYDNTDNTEADKEYAIMLGKSSINSAKQLQRDDEEFKTLSFVFEMLDLAKRESNVRSLFQKLHEIKNKCPLIENIKNTLIKNEALREWFDNAYYDILFDKLAEGGDIEKDLEMKAQYAMELKNSSNEFFQLFAHAFLADALYDEGKYNESKRYAKLGMDISIMSDYDHEDGLKRCWGMCFTIYARSQEKLGNMDDALEMFEKGASMGIPWCKQDMERLSKSDDIVVSSCGSFTKSEQEYLETLKDNLEDGELSSRERKMLDRIRVSLGISEERAKELEIYLNSPQLTENEQEYLDAYKESASDGEMTEKERRLLEKLRIMYNISEERARELEKM